MKVFGKFIYGVIGFHGYFVVSLINWVVVFCELNWFFPEQKQIMEKVLYNEIEMRTIFFGWIGCLSGRE